MTDYTEDELAFFHRVFEVARAGRTDELAPVLAEWSRRREPERFAHLEANPGRIHPRPASTSPRKENSS